MLHPADLSRKSTEIFEVFLFTSDAQAIVPQNLKYEILHSFHACGDLAWFQ